MYPAATAAGSAPEERRSNNSQARIAAGGTSVRSQSRRIGGRSRWRPFRYDRERRNWLVLSGLRHGIFVDTPIIRRPGLERNHPLLRQLRGREHSRRRRNWRRWRALWRDL